MAMTRSESALFTILAATRLLINHKLDELRAARDRRKVYSETYAKLAAMSDRNLKDIGTSRSGIQRMALEAANGE